MSKKSKWQDGKCEIAECVSNSINVTEAFRVIDAKEAIKEVVMVCIHCYTLFGEELPKEETVKKKLTDYNTFVNKKEKESEKIGGFRV